jgi:hypothetical protein
MKRPSIVMGATLWIVGSLMAAYLIVGVILYFDLFNGMRLLGHLPKPAVRFLLEIYAPVLQVLGKIWPELFPFYP